MELKVDGSKCPARLGNLALLALGVLAQSVSGAENWHIMESDNVQICSNLPKGKLERLDRDIHYFNRALEAMFDRKLKRMDEPIHVLLAKGVQDLRPYMGERAKDIAGAYIGSPGFAMIVARGDVARLADLSSVIYHEMTHVYLSSFDLPLWQNEGFAELFKTVEVDNFTVSVGRANESWINFQNLAPKPRPQDYQAFFLTTASSDYYLDGDTAPNFYNRAWLFAHYCWQGRTELREPYLKLGQSRYVDEDLFKSLFGFGFRELDKRLREHARNGRYMYTKFKIKDLPAPPAARIRPATESERIVFQARAYCLTNQMEKGAELLAQCGEDGVAALEVGWLLATREPLPGRAVELARKAVESGSKNPSVLEFHARHRFRQLASEREGRSPILSVAEARELIGFLQVAMHSPDRFPQAVGTLILILDAAGSSAPPELLAIFDKWKNTYRGAGQEALAALQRIQQRSLPEDQSR